MLYLLDRNQLTLEKGSTSHLLAPLLLLYDWATTGEITKPSTTSENAEGANLNSVPKGKNKVNLVTLTGTINWKLVHIEKPQTNQLTPSLHHESHPLVSVTNSAIINYFKSLFYVLWPSKTWSVLQNCFKTEVAQMSSSEVPVLRTSCQLPS